MSSNKPSSVYNELRLEGKFCDAVIKVEDVEFQIHKVILCNCSPYFCALFSRWSAEDRLVFNIAGLSPRMMELIIEFAYTGSISVTEDNVQELLLAADLLNVVDVVQICSDFLSEQLCPENCIGIWQFTNICFCSELQRKAYSYIIDNFEEVVSQEEFLRLSAQELTDIIEGDDLNVRKESTVYESILHWIAHIPEERETHMAVLLSKVRLALTNEEYIKDDVMSNELVKYNNECLQIASDAMQTIHHINPNSPFVTCVRNPLARPRLPNAILFATGGWSGGAPTNGIEAYDVRANRWINVTNNLERPRAYHGAVFLNGYVYCVGGFDRVEHFNSVRRFDLSTHTWHEVAPMYCRRCYVSVTVLNGCIYAMGGYDGHARLSSAEHYRPETNQWSLIASMNEQRSDASCTTLHDKVGEVGQHQRGTLPDFLHVHTNNTALIDDHLFVVGGFNGFTTTQNVEYYDASTDEWSDACDMEIFRSALSCCVVTRFPNMSEYTFPRDALPLLLFEGEAEESGDAV
uniref:BTB domain-containing protein n=1 Tax=Anabas testudineus TaxID=64144 RepID=A0A7N6AKN6_ANATE